MVFMGETLEECDVIQRVEGKVVWGLHLHALGLLSPHLRRRVS